MRECGCARVCVSECVCVCVCAGLGLMTSDRIAVVVDAVGAHRLRQRPGKQGAEAYNQRAGDGEAPLPRRQVEGRLRAVVARRGQHLFWW